MKIKEKISFPSILDIQKTNRIAKELFGTEKDDTQAKPTQETALKLISIEKYNFICYKNNDEVIAWSVVLPTSKESMHDFLEGKINERDLFTTSLSKPAFETLYLTAVIVLPKYRRNGIGSSLMKKQIEYFKEKYKIDDFYALTLTQEGKKLIEAIGRDLHVKISSISRT